MFVCGANAEAVTAGCTLAVGAAMDMFVEMNHAVSQSHAVQSSCWCTDQGDEIERCMRAALLVQKGQECMRHAAPTE